MTFDVFAAGTQGDGTGFSSPGNLGNNVNLANNGWLATANIDYDVNIANAVDQHVALLARPHLTTLSGSPASFLAGGEIIFEVSGLNSGDIEPYPFGTTLLVTPTLLQTPGDTGAPRIHIVAEAGRTSILSLLSADSTNDDRTSFTKIEVQSESVLDLGQTLVLSGLSQREKTTVKSGVPILRSIPVLSLFFSNRTTIDSELSVIILLTPRDPAYIDKKTRKDFQDFVQMRRDFIGALKDEEVDLIKFKEKYPHWYEITPNRLSSHIFMAQNSEGYQKFMGQDLSSEDLKFNLLSPKLEKR
jgi:type II secretory pathway component GspD/PulD (secretin)